MIFKVKNKTSRQKYTLPLHPRKDYLTPHMSKGYSLNPKNRPLYQMTWTLLNSSLLLGEGHRGSEVRWQPSGADSLLAPWGFRGETQVIRCGGECPDWLRVSHLASPELSLMKNSMCCSFSYPLSLVLQVNEHSWTNIWGPTRGGSVWFFPPPTVCRMRCLVPAFICYQSCVSACSLKINFKPHLHRGRLCVWR